MGIPALTPKEKEAFLRKRGVLPWKNEIELKIRGRSWKGEKVTSRYALGYAIVNGVQFLGIEGSLSWYKGWKEKGGQEPEKFIWVLDLKKKSIKQFHTKKQARKYIDAKSNKTRTDG